MSLRISEKRFFEAGRNGVFFKSTVHFCLLSSALGADEQEITF